MQTRKILFKTLGALIAVAVLLALLPGSHVQGATLCVNPGGTGGCYGDIQAAIAAAADGDTIEVAAGTYVETAQIVIDKNLTIIGENKATTTIKPAQSTGSGGDARGWFLVQSGKEFNLSNVTLDGDGKEIYQAIRSHGTGTIENNIIQNIIYPGYQGVGVVAMGGNMIIRANKLENIGRIGIMAFGSGVTDAQITGNTYTGKGEGDHLDYGIEIGGGAKATITGNTISNCLGVASGTWGSAAILVTDHYGPKSTATIIDNDLTDNEFGISIGYSGTDTSIVAIATGNKFTRNLFPISARNTTNIDMAAAFAENTFDKAVMIQGDTVIYSSIQSAINWANAGDTILVGPGTYEEALLLNKKGITVQGADPDNPPVIKGELTIDHTGATTIRGIDFEVQNILHDSIYIKKGNGITIEDCKFDGGGRETITGRRGIQAASDVSNVTVERCTFTNGYDISIQGNMSDLTVKNSTFTDVKSGINQQGGGGLVVEDCYFKNKPFNDGNSYGVRYTAVGGKSLSITRSTFEIDLEGAPDPGSGKYHGSIILRGSNADTTSVKDNTILGGVWNASTAATLNASPNWWGSPCGPSRVHGTATYAPWYADEAMTILRSENVSGEYTFPSGTSHEEINAVVACAAPGTEFTFEKGTHAGGIVIPEGQNELVFNLADGAKFGNNAPCFEVYANDITIEAESKLGAVCYPGSHGVVVGAGVDSFELINLEIDGTNMSPGNGVHFEGAVSNVWLVNNFIHDIKGTPTATGNGVFFTDGLGGFHNYIQGNLFHNNDGNGIEAGTAAIDARYNAWGHFKGAEVGDGFSSGVEWQNDHTHVDLYLVSSGTHYPNQVVKGEDITYTIKGSLANIQGMEFTLTLPEQVSYVAGSFSQLLSGGFSNFGASVNSEGNLVIYAFQYSETGVTTPVNAEDEALFEFKLSGVNFGKELAIGYINTNFSFAHQQGDEGPTNNVYPTLLLGIDDLEVIDLPKLSQDGLTDPLTVGIEREFTITLENPEEGGVFEHTLIYIFVKDAKLDDIYSFVCYDEDDNPYNALLSEDGQGNLVGTWGPPDGFELTAPYKEITKCEVTFKEPGEYEVEITLVDEDTDWELARLEFTVVVNAGDFSVTGTVSMQGRTLRSGVPMTLTSLIFGDFTELSGPTITDNLLFEGLNGGDYLITTLQERYLNIHEGLNKTIYLNGNVKLPLLHLFGGNAYWKNTDGTFDNVIDISDAGLVGGAYGGAGSTTPTGGNHADVNFDGKVNIQDLALVGGNFGLTSAGAYEEWMP